MKDKGFTLVEVLVVIVILSLLMSIAISASQRINKKIKDKLYDDKINLAKKSGIIWGNDNTRCFTTESDKQCEEF